MSGLHPEADIWAGLQQVRFVPTRKSPNLFDHLLGAGEKGFRDGQPIAFAVLRSMTSSNLVGCLTGRGADCIGDSKAG